MALRKLIDYVNDVGQRGAHKDDRQNWDRWVAIHRNKVLESDLKVCPICHLLERLVDRGGLTWSSRAGGLRCSGRWAAGRGHTRQHTFCSTVGYHLAREVSKYGLVTSAVVAITKPVTMANCTPGEIV